MRTKCQCCSDPPVGVYVTLHNNLKISRMCENHLRWFLDHYFLTKPEAVAFIASTNHIYKT